VQTLTGHAGGQLTRGIVRAGWKLWDVSAGASVAQCESDITSTLSGTASINRLRAWRGHRAEAPGVRDDAGRVRKSQ
jgi:hypothetical protein